MKQILSITLIALVIVSCGRENIVQKNFTYKWVDKRKIFIKDGNITLNDTAQKMHVFDSTVVFYIDKYIDEDLKKTVVSLDTFIFDFRRMYGDPYLILFKDNGYTSKGTLIMFLSVFTLKEEIPIEIKETNHLKQRTLKIEGYSVGDTIDRNLFTSGYTMRYGYSTDSTLINIVELLPLKSNTDVEAEIIGNKYILRLTRRDIPYNDIDDLISSISYKMGFEPRQIKKQTGKREPPNEHRDWIIPESYRWQKNGLQIVLEKQFDLDNWRLEYDNFIIMEALLTKFKNIPPKSKYIN